MSACHGRDRQRRDRGRRVYLLHRLGADTGVDLDALVDCVAWVSGVLMRENGSKVGRAMQSDRHRQAFYRCTPRVPQRIDAAIRLATTLAARRH
jgi:hypothetical protein